MTMLVDATIQRGVLRHLAYTSGAFMVVALMLLSGLPLLFKLLLIGLFLLLNYGWYRLFVATQVLAEIWQQDAVVWGWRYLSSPQSHTATLLQAHYLGVLIVLSFQCRNTSISMLIWRDEVSGEEWRKLSVLTRLKQSSPTLF